MEKDKLNIELDFIRSQAKIYEKKIKALEGGSWRKNVSEDFDASTLYGAYNKILREHQSLLRHQYDAER